MNIKIYTTSNKPNTINKSKVLVRTVTGNALEPLNIISPTVTFKIDESLINCNYAYIAKFARYYYIKDMKFDKGMMILELDVDVLESFKSDILAYNGILSRSEYDYNLNLEDREISAYSKPLIQTKKFPNTPFNVNLEEADKKFILITTSN